MSPSIVKRFSSASSANRAVGPTRLRRRPNRIALPYAGDPVFFAASRSGGAGRHLTRRGAREAEGAPLLREYRVKSSIEGSNPSLSASQCSVLKDDFRRAFLRYPSANRKEINSDSGLT